MAIRPKFEVLEISRCGDYARLRDDSLFEFNCPRIVPAFGAHLIGSDFPQTVLLEAGQTIEATVRGQDTLIDVFVVSGPGAEVERRYVEGVGPNATPVQVVPEKSIVDQTREANAEMRRMLDSLVPCE
jgi:hypothetical protein